MKKILFISSTGGHLTELLQLSPMFENCDFHLITENTESNQPLKEKYGDRFDTLVFGTKVHLFTYLFKFAYNCLKSLWLYFKIKPDYVITTGTHTAVPMCKIAHGMKAMW